ncbi:class I adenylate-forming enzyme family protein [Mycolicibacterium arenosum]|uniref:Acyl--CoA ligase n=1 Tax=Mycolicibacterium arenosum TaxID=2952157 RepID=A0ABT1M6Q1_9MYCO|nr:class I adenylate-forming enzyme family protein [Mycolicibacterium sp. CAU 1645]MCP9274462.1 acyl--CoA ligase [Mycolicibacterium sp. CAU 1645]
MIDTVDSLLTVRASAAKDAIVDPVDRISYAELDAETRFLATSFVTAGVGKGSHVGLVMPNGVSWVRTALALLRIGAVLVPLSTLLAPRELVSQLRVAGVRHLVAVDEFRGHRYLDALRAELSAPGLGEGPVCLENLPALRDVWHPDSLPASGDADTADALAASVDPSDDMVVMFTSGSSGTPKGVKHSHGSALGAVRASLQPRCIDSDTRLYLPMPFFWVGGFGGGVLSALLAGATLVTEPIPTPESTLRLLERERVTLFRGWPDQAEALARQADSADLSALRQGSLEALLPPAQRAAPGARARLFGMTESFGPYCGFAADTDMPASAHGSCGKPFAGMEVRVVDVDTREPVETGRVGELQVRGPHTLRGICRRAREEIFTEDGYYPTGDLGHLDADGFMFYHGRTDDMFKVSGATVYPSEVEAGIRTLDDVDAAFVTNVPGPTGDRVGALVVCAPSLTTEALTTAARNVLSAYKVPTVWLLARSRDAVPRGTTGKVDISRLRDMLLTATTDGETR